MQVKLTTRADEFVTKFAIPDFQTPPDVLHWGNRIFVFDHKENDEQVFVEGWAFAVPHCERSFAHCPEINRIN